MMRIVWQMGLILFLVSLGSFVVAFVRAYRDARLAQDDLNEDEEEAIERARELLGPWKDKPWA